MNLRRILLSLIVTGGVVALGVAGTRAFFNDTETSTGNTFQSGSIDLLVDSQSHYAGLVCKGGIWVVEGEAGTTRPDLEGKACTGAWAEDNLDALTNPAFFNFADLKPGDSGENTISLHVKDNDAYMCAVIDNMHDNDLGLTEPEQKAGDNTDGADAGELSPELHFFAWDDNGGNTPGDNIWQAGEAPLFSNVEGPASDVLGGKVYSMFTPGNAFPGGQTRYIGMYWCYGKLTVDQNNNTLTCDGAPVTNLSQTDELKADLSFYVEQARNNDNFACPTIEAWRASHQ